MNDKWADEDYREIFAKNRAWAAEKAKASPDFFEKMSAGQSPEYLYIGCSDSRVDETDLFQKGPGEVFVHRNIANIVSSLDMSSASVIEFAVRYLKVHHIVVCGHYGCGGVQASLMQKDFGILNPWLRNVRDVYRMHKDELDKLAEIPRARRLVEHNVIEQCLNVTKTAVVQESYLARGYPTVHGWVFDIETGLINDLNVNFASLLKDVQQVYNLTGQAWYE